MAQSRDNKYVKAFLIGHSFITTIHSVNELLGALRELWNSDEEHDNILELSVSSL
jgi:HEPN domain-containing protein